MDYRVMRKGNHCHGVAIDDDGTEAHVTRAKESRYQALRELAKWAQRNGLRGG